MLILDIRTIRQITQRGVYGQMPDDKRRLVPEEQRVEGHDEDEFSAAIDHSFPNNDYRRDPSVEIDQYSHQSRKQYKTHAPISAQNFGYQAPSEQTSYDSPNRL